MFGKRGPGKTQFAVELLRVNRNGYYATAVEFFMAVKSSYRDKGDGEESVVKRFAKYALLILDEIGKRGETGWENSLLFEMIDRRYRNMRDTLIISNEDRARFEANIGPSIASRMSETGGLIDCTTWKSFR
jgi:DNA replication protein DnaC